MSETRNWKWMVPGVLTGLGLILARAFFLSPYEWVRWVGVVPLFAALMSAVACVSNFRHYQQAHMVDLFERRRQAETMSVLAVQMTAARGVHPDTAKILLEESHRVWALRAGNRDMRVPAHSVLYHAPDVTDFFLRYVLEGSTETYVMPKRILVEGRKNRFDPFGAVDEYRMYDSLMGLWVREGKVLKYSEFEPFAWVQPWGPRVVAEEYGLVLEVKEEVKSEVQ